MGATHGYIFVVKIKINLIQTYLQKENDIMQESLFENKASEPLASRLRPNTLEKFVGQGHLIGKGKLLKNLIENDEISSMIFWGPPGVGKSTLARIIASNTKS